MSCFSALTAEQKEKNKKSKKLDTMLNVIGKSAREEIKLLLLGLIFFFQSLIYYNIYFLLKSNSRSWGVWKKYYF